ncbi:hypothetical protein ON010_g15476 [Phytophthora cinnamomi]|nr:hypothetical protein ON010_g15476 [Phytophthora cinnamomi]
MPGDADRQTLSENLQAAMNAAPKDPVELARLVRELHSDPEQPHSSDEKKLLTDAGLAVLEPELAGLLGQLRMTDIAPLLVCGRVCDVNAVARALVVGAVEGWLEPAEVLKLTAKLETRGAIVEAGSIATSAAWLDKLCRKCPTKRVLRQCKWSTLEGLMMQVAIPPSEAEREAVWTVWSEGHDLREKRLSDSGVDEGERASRAAARPERREQGEVAAPVGDRE